MTDHDSVGRSAAQFLPCGHQHKRGTRFCTVCGRPVPAQVSAQDDAYANRAYGATQTVQARDNPAMPGGGSGGLAEQSDDTSAATRLRPRVPRERDGGPPAPGPGPAWHPGEDWQPGPEWQARQGQPRQDWQQPAQRPDASWDQQGGQWQRPAPWEQPPQWQQPPGTGRPSGPFPASPPPATGRSRWPVVAGVIAAAVLLGGGTGTYLLLGHHHTPSSSAANSATLPPSSPATAAAATATSTAPPSTTPPATTSGVTEQQAATSLASLLQQSVSDRSAITQAYNDVDSCGSQLGQDRVTFQQAASSRQSLISQLSSLSGASALPAGMLSDLKSAWQASATVDQDYAQWAADENANGCVANDTGNSNYVAASGPNGQATSGKTAFVGLWNPVAQKYGLTQYSPDQL